VALPFAHICMKGVVVGERFVIGRFFILPSATLIAVQSTSSAHWAVPHSWRFTVRSGRLALLVEPSPHSCGAWLLIS
jgi:hypothetical protein